MEAYQEYLFHRQSVVRNYAEGYILPELVKLLSGQAEIPLFHLDRQESVSGGMNVESVVIAPGSGRENKWNMLTVAGSDGILAGFGKLEMILGKYGLIIAEPLIATTGSFQRISGMIYAQQLQLLAHMPSMDRKLMDCEVAKVVSTNDNLFELERLRQRRDLVVDSDDRLQLLIQHKETEQRNWIGLHERFGFTPEFVQDNNPNQKPQSCATMVKYVHLTTKEAISYNQTCNINDWAASVLAQLNYLWQV